MAKMIAKKPPTAPIVRLLTAWGVRWGFQLYFGLLGLAAVWALWRLGSRLDALHLLLREGCP